MKIVIIGSGIAGFTFADKFRQLSPDAEITLITKENEGYYSRPRLSKGFSTDDIEQSIIIQPFSALEDKKINVISAAEVSSIDCQRQQLTLLTESGIETRHYDKLILATGSAAFIPPPYLPYQDHFFVFNSLTDLKKLRCLRQNLLQQNKQPHWAIIGGGLIGCEIASDLALANDHVSIFHSSARLMERQLVEVDSEALLTVFKEDGIDVYLNQTITSLNRTGYKVMIEIALEQHEFDAVIVSCGFKPRIELAQQAGLVVARGIKTDQYLQTSDQNIFALGDVAELPNGKLYAFIMPIRHQALWLAGYLSQQTLEPWQPPAFSPSAKINHFTATEAYSF